MKSWIPTYKPTLSNSICPHSSQPSSSSALIAFRFDEKERYYTYKSQTLIPWALTDGTSCSLACPLGHYVRLLFHVWFDREHFELKIVSENCLGIKKVLYPKIQFSIRNVHDQTGHGTKVSRSDQVGKQVSKKTLKRGFIPQVAILNLKCS